MLVKLHGELGELFTPEIEVFCNKPRDCIGIINANFPGFENYFFQHATDRFEVILNNEITLAQLDLDFQFERLETLDIYPTIEGSGKGALGKILGIGLVIGALAIPGFQIFGMSATHLGLMGGVMALKGFFGAKSPSKIGEEEENKKSELFNGNLDGTSAEMVPIVTGRIKVQGIPISLDIKTALTANP
jgi:predicted phage tail protein